MNPTDKTMQQAIEEYYSTDSEKSMETLKALVEKSPEDTVLQAFLADAYTKHGKDAEAKELLNGLKDKDLSGDALIFVVRAYDALGHQESAKEVLMKHFPSASASASASAPASLEEAPNQSMESPEEAPKQPEAQAGGKKSRKQKRKNAKNATKRKQRQ